MTGWEAIRLQVLKRDNHVCQICYKQVPLDAHHIIPRRKKGLDSLNNVFAVCGKCHDLIELRLEIDRSSVPMTIVGVNKKLIRQLKHIAADKDTTITALVEQAIEEFLIKKQKKKSV